MRGILGGQGCAKCAYNSLTKRVGPKTRDVTFIHASYTIWSNLRDAVIYCDPPYYGTTGYNKNTTQSIAFDSLAFYQWVAGMAQYNTVFVTEYSIPQGLDYTPVHAWERSRNGLRYADGRPQPIERLIRVHGQHSELHFDKE